MRDPATVQFVFADLQDSIVPAGATNPASSLRRAAGVLGALAPVLGIPFTVSAAPRPGGPEVIEELPEAEPYVRTGPSCWDDTAWREAVLATGRRNLVICGVTTEIVVLRTALDALAHGLSVQVPVDACGGMTARTEQAALRQIEAAGGVVTSVAGVVSDMVRDFTTPVGRQVIAALHQLV
ncbi:isochorismatase family protein [Nonomuraea sp. SMC257]|uniref:Isochorismatase family protein n=1 Tax=Nonomuraea montanisoli TaxID=2741721 RepID=A0A7Y6I710_9ACTN|nr:isochorismatase family protein [Nonomuraea montanisoli]NUW31614.1 isochorismatase family protein [Nonomuraea montanisoli]